MRFITAILYGVNSSVLTALLLGLLGHGLNEPIAAAALGLGIAVTVTTLWQPPFKIRIKLPAIGAWEWAAILLFTLFSLRAFLWLIFRDRDAIRVLSPNNLGDMPLHITYIRHLANGVPLWPNNPIYAGAKLTYPLGIDLFNSLLTLIGVDLFRGLIWTGLGGALLTGMALWKWGRGFVLAGFLCNGGLLGFLCFREGTLADFQADAAWKSIPLALFVTQRGFLFALPAGVVLLCNWRARFFLDHKTNGEWRLPLWGEVFLYASMPLFHLHTFLFLSFVLGCWFFCMPSARKPLAILIGSAFLPATALVLLVTGMFKGASVLGWQPGWMQGNENFLVFWIKNFGALPLFIGALCFGLIKNKDARWPMAMTVPALLLFLLCCFIKFAPWAWDNTKLMIWSYLAILPFLWSEVIVRLSLPARLISCTALFFSGLVSLLGGLGSDPRGHEIALRSELDAVEYAVRGLPAAARFAAAPAYNHPLLLAGRALAMGYEGHVWSHGYDFVTRREQVTTLMNGGPEWRQIAMQLDVRYLFWSALEKEAFPESIQPWKKEAPCIALGDWGEIYDLQTQVNHIEIMTDK